MEIDGARLLPDLDAVYAQNHHPAYDHVFDQRQNVSVEAEEPETHI